MILQIMRQKCDFEFFSSSQWLSQNSIGTHVSCKRLADWSSLFCNWGNSKGRWFVRHSFLKKGHHLLNGSTFRKSRRMGLGIPLASDDGVTFNGSPQVDVEEMRVKLNNLLQGKEFSDGLVQSLHDAARVFEMTIKEQSSLSKLPWFATAWLGVDRSAWVKALSYQIMSQRRFERGALTLASAHLKCLRCGLV